MALTCLFAATPGCSRPSTEAGRELPSAAPNTSASTSAAPRKRTAPETLPPVKPVVSPRVPPELVSCSGRDFYRITPQGLEVFEAAAVIPPPELRGSAAAVQKTALAIREPSNLIALTERAVLVLARDGVFRYDKGQSQLRSYAAIAEPSPRFAWIDSKQPGELWVRPLDGRSLSRYSLASLAASGSSSVAPRGAGSNHELAGFDGRLFGLSSDGTPLYSTAEGLARARRGTTAPVPMPALPLSTTLVFADASPDRFWAADAEGNLGLWDGKQSSPIATARVPGVVIDAVHEGERVAVLSMELSGRRHTPIVTVFSKANQEAQLRLGPSPASQTQPELDLCLLGGRPWVVVGGQRWLQLLDWSAPRLLAEW